MTVLLRRTPTQTASRHSASLPVHEIGVLQSSDDTLCNFARGLSPQRRWEHAPCVRNWNINSLHLRALLNLVLWDDLQDFDNSFLNVRDWNIDEFVQGCPLKRAPVASTGSPPQSPPESGKWARPRSDRATLHALLWCDLVSFHNFLHELWRREVHNLCLLEHELSHLCDFLHDLPKTVVEKAFAQR